MSPSPALSLSQGVSCFVGIPWGVSLGGSSALHPFSLVLLHSPPAQGAQSIPQLPRETGICIPGCLPSSL